MKKIVVGILAHVDSGKTTLSEAFLFKSGSIKKLGRVDKLDATLDNHDLEKKRGITIFSKQAMFQLKNTQVSLVDTPGHTDFSSEMERVLGVLDYAILVINGADGVQSHTQTLWELLKLHNIPTFIFVNKVDLIAFDKQNVLNQIKNQLDSNVVCINDDNFIEKIAECDETLLNIFLDTEQLDASSISSAISKRNVFLCAFGSALKLVGIDEFLDVIDKYTSMHESSQDFSGKVFKISRDFQNVRLTHLKITSGSLKVKDILGDSDEKIQQIRLYSGDSFSIVPQVSAGSICAVVGPQKTYAGQGISQADLLCATLSPILNYSIILNEQTDSFLAYEKIKILSEEDPLLKITWSEITRSIYIGIMGEVQIEILKEIIKQRFDLDVDFGQGEIVYKETILDTVEGVGHFEPLRHYAEVRLILEPLKSGSGIVVVSKCMDDSLSKSFQKLVVSHLLEIEHKGALTGSYITDIKITLVDGKSHVKHTDGGDFRQASYRALHQALIQASSKVLEPYYSFKLEVPVDAIGRAMSDLDKFFAKTNPPIIQGNIAILEGNAPVVTMRDYAKNISSYTKGQGKISCRFSGYFDCHNESEVISKLNFDRSLYPECNPNSVFCANGSGFNVEWDNVFKYAHTSQYLQKKDELTHEHINSRVAKIMSCSDDELMKIFERTYGEIKLKNIQPMRITPDYTHALTDFSKPEYLLVDGYNIIFAWDNLAEIARHDIESARHKLMEILCNYKAFKGCEVVLVFDAYKVAGNKGNVEKYANINVVYTKEAETADMYIEKSTYSLAKNVRVRVATSDALEQQIILGHGALRVSAENFYREVMQVDEAIRKFCK